MPTIPIRFWAKTNSERVGEYDQNDSGVDPVFTTRDGTQFVLCTTQANKYGRVIVISPPYRAGVTKISSIEISEEDMTIVMELFTTYQKAIPILKKIEDAIGGVKI